MALTVRQKTTFLRWSTIVLLSIAWIASICTLILGFIGISNFNANNAYLAAAESATADNSTSDALTISAFDPNGDAAIPKLGASIGLIGAIVIAVPLSYAMYRTFRPVKLGGISMSTGTLFNRWVGGLILSLSLVIIAVTAALTHERRALLDDSDVAISTLCFIIGIFTLLTSLLILIKPKAVLKLPLRRRYLSYEVNEGYYSPKSDQSHLSGTDHKDFTSAPHLATPSIIRSQSVQRKRVDYFAYLFDDGTTTPTASEVGHQAYTRRAPFDVSSGDYEVWRQGGDGKNTANDTCSSSISEVMLPSLHFQDGLTEPPKVKSSRNPKMKRARIYDHKTGAIAMLPYESNCNSRVSL